MRADRGVRLTPEALLGRVTSVSRLIAVGAIPLGSLAAGALLERLGPLGTVAVLAAWLLLVAAAASPSVRHAPPTA